VPDDVAFRVYGNETTIADLKDQAATDGALYGFAPPTDGPKLDGFNRAMAKAAAVSQIIDHAAKEKNIVIADRQVSDRVAQFVTSAYGPGEDGRAKFIQALASQGTSEPKVLAEFKRQMTLSELISQVTAGIQVPDDELQRYFDGHKAELATPELRDLHNMVLDSKEQADQVVAQLSAGGNFEQLAQQNSLDQTTKDQGGALGVHPASDLEPQFAAAAFGAPLNGIFGPVQGSHGWNVGKVVAITPSAPAVFPQIKDQLRQYLISKKGSDMFRDFLGKQIKDADVVYNKAYKPADPDGLPDPNAAGPDGAAPAPGGAPAPGEAPAPAPGQPPR
jgi:peptidyl-prolyl cis-trans isomerase C